jgi:hypothetical protein
MDISWVPIMCSKKKSWIRFGLAYQIFFKEKQGTLEHRAGHIIGGTWYVPTFGWETIMTTWKDAIFTAVINSTVRAKSAYCHLGGSFSPNAWSKMSILHVM